MISRDALLAIEWFVGFIGLLLGCMGLAGFASPVLKPHLPVWIGAVICCGPILIVYTITFFKQSFLPPRPFRFCLVLAMGWFAVLTIAAEVLCHLGYMPAESPAYARTLARVLMHLGWFSFIPIVRLFVTVRRYESA